MDFVHSSVYIRFSNDLLLVFVANLQYTADACGHPCKKFDGHAYCFKCRTDPAPGKDIAPLDPCQRGEPCRMCSDFTPEQVDALQSKRPYASRGIYFRPVVRCVRILIICN